MAVNKVAVNRAAVNKAAVNRAAADRVAVSRVAADTAAANQADDKTGSSELTKRRETTPAAFVMSTHFLYVYVIS